MTELDPRDYTIAWIAPLEIEAKAATCMLDHLHQGRFSLDRGDDYVYVAGDISGRNVIIATLPAGQEYGTGSAAALASQVKKFFPNLWFGLLVGVAAGLPLHGSASPRDIRLGDVLVALPEGESAGLIAYDLGKETVNGFQPLHGGHAMATTEPVIRSAIGSIKRRAPYDASVFLPYYEQMKDQEHGCGTFIDPGQDVDHLYERDEEGATKLVERDPRDDTMRTRVWYGPIGSGDKVMKSYTRRNELRDTYRVIGLEMEAAGTMNRLPVGVIRGVCDYGDEHKNKDWQPYAAAMAAAYAKAILAEIGPRRAQMSRNSFSLPIHIREIEPVIHFVGRKTELDRVDSILGASEGRCTLVIHGLGGMGKTQLTKTYLKKHSKAYSALVWLNARDRTTLKVSFSKVASRILQQYPNLTFLRDAVASQDMDRMVEGVKRWLDDTNNDKWIAVFDGYDHPDLKRPGEEHESTPSLGVFENATEGATSSRALASKQYDVRDFFPNHDQGAIIVTTRSSTVQIGHLIKLDKLVCKTESLKILELTSNRQNIKNDTAAVQLTELLDGLPLALSTAGSYLNGVATSCSDYLEYYQKSWARLKKPSPTLLCYEHTLFNAWDISLSRVEEENPASAILLRLWAYFDHEDLWFELLRDTALETKFIPCETGDKIDFDQIMRVLSRVALAEPDNSPRDLATESRGYTVHACVHSWIKHGIHTTIDPEMARVAMLAIASHLPSDDEQEFCRKQRRLLVHADRCIETMENGVTMPMHQRWVYGLLGYLFSCQDRYDEACNIYERAIRGYDDDDDERMLGFKNDLGLIYVSKGRLDEAQTLYEQALKGLERICGPKSLSLLAAIDNLGSLHLKKGDYTQAEAMMTRALSIKEADDSLGPLHILTLKTVTNLGNFYYKAGRFSDAEVMYRRAMEGYEVQGRSEDTNLHSVMNNLATLFTKQNRFSDAEAMYNNVLNKREQTWGNDHSLTLETVQNMALLYVDLGRLDDAESMYDRAFASILLTSEREYEGKFELLHNFGNLRLQQGRLEEAEDLFTRSLRGKQSKYGPTNPSTIQTLNNLGVTYRRLNRLNDAKSAFRQALSAGEAIQGSAHPSTLETVWNLGNLYMAQNRLDEADAMYQRALSGLEASVGPNHKSTLDVVNGLGHLRQMQGRSEDAECLLVRAANGREAIFGPDHNCTLGSLASLSGLYMQLGRTEDAAMMHRQLLTRKEKLLGSDHQSTLIVANDLGFLYESISRHEEALELYTRALRGFEKAYSSDLTVNFEAVVMVLENLGSVYCKLCMHEDAETQYKRARDMIRVKHGEDHERFAELTSLLQSCRKNA